MNPRDKLYLALLLLGAGLLLFLGRDLLESAVLVTWGLAFGGTTAVAILLVLLYRLRLELAASRHQLARTEAELNFALTVQQALFPRQLPRGQGLEFAATCIPARGVSGDYYDVFQVPDGRLVVAIADISGKGISAAILMANLQALLRVFARSERSPRQVCNKLNHHFHQVTDSTRFATCFYAEWNPVERRLRYVNAGHYPPIALGSCGGAALDEGGIPLGLLPSYDFGMGEVRLQPNDLLALYSDGITEVGVHEGEEFGAKRLRAAIAQHGRRPVAEIQSRVLEAVRSWSANEPEDDMTLVIMRATEAP